MNAQKITSDTQRKYERSMRKSLFSDKDYNLWMLVARTRDAMLRARQKELRRYNIRVKQAGTLLVIQMLGDKARPAEICRRLFRDSQSVCEILDRMEKQGLVKRIKEPDKTRRVRVVLTEKGQKAYQYSLKRDSIHNIIGCLSKEEQKQFESFLVRIRERALQEIQELDTK